MKQYVHLHFNSLCFFAFMCLCSCSGCDIEVNGIELSDYDSSHKPVDLTTGNCLVNEIESELKESQEKKLTTMLMKQLPDIFSDSVVHITTVPASKLNYKIPFDISAGLLDTLRRTTSYTYLLSVKVWESETNDLNSKASVDIDIYDLDTGNRIYEHRVTAFEEDPEYDEDAKSTFTFGRSSFSVLKKAFQRNLKDLRRAANKSKELQVSDSQ